MTPAHPPIDARQITCLFFDLDDTLYPHSSGLWELIGQRIQRFMIEELRFAAAEVPELSHRLWRQYGTTLRGLQTEYAVDMDAYLAYVHAVPVDVALAPDPSLAQALAALPQRKFIFTNSDRAHARRVTERLGIAPLFEGIIDIYTVAPHCKPEPEAFHKALEICGTPPERCLMIDDSPRNLAAARALGITTVSVGQHTHDGSPHFETIQDFLAVFPNSFR